MALTVKNAKLWFVNGADRPGFLAGALEPLAAAGVGLRSVMAYRHPGHPGVGDHATIEVFPVTGKKAETAARAAGMAPSQAECLLVEGDDRPGLTARFGRAVADAGVNMSFLMGQVIGRKFAMVIGFASGQDAGAAAKAIKAAAKKR
jgi:predicted amino acid-binding ACT domain protein